MKRTYLLISLLLFAAILSAPVLAGSTITIVDIVNVDGKIGLDITNEIGLSMQTDNEVDNTSVLNYYINNTTIYSIPAKSASSIPTEETKRIVIDYTWPATGYYELKVVFSDNTGYAHEAETGYIFAKTGLALVEAWTDPELVTSNASFTLHLKMRASGEGDVSQIDLNHNANPKYYTYHTHSSLPESLKQGEEATYSFTYKLSGQSMADTIIYDTVYAPVQFSYMYLNRSAKTKLNESVVVFNRLKIGDNLPEMSSLIDVSNTLVRGKTIDVPVHVWNSKAGSHSACNMNLTLSDEDDTLVIPISNIIRSDITFPPAAAEADEATATFQLDLPESLPEGKYTLVLEGVYKECEWNAPGSFKHTKEIIVVMPTVINETPAVPGEKISDGPAKAETTGGKTLRNYLIIGVLIIATIFAVVFLLEKKGRYI